MKKKTLKKSRNRRVKNYRKISRKKVKTRDRHRTTHGIPMRKRMKKRTRHRSYRGGVKDDAPADAVVAAPADAPADADAATVLFQVYIEKYPMRKKIKRDWVSQKKKRYFVLYNDKIEYYKNKEEFDKQQNPIRTLYIKDIENVFISNRYIFLFLKNSDILELAPDSYHSPTLTFIEKVRLIIILPDDLLKLNFAILLEVLYYFNILNGDKLKIAIGEYHLHEDEKLKKEYIQLFQKYELYYKDIFKINNYITLFKKRIWRDEAEKKKVETRKELVKEIETYYNEISSEDKISNMEQKAEELVKSNPNYKALIYVATYILLLKTQLQIKTLFIEEEEG